MLLTTFVNLIQLDNIWLFGTCRCVVKKQMYWTSWNFDFLTKSQGIIKYLRVIFVEPWMFVQNFMPVHLADV